MSNKKVFVSGCYDLLHSGHVEFFRQASQYGDLYVGSALKNSIKIQSQRLETIKRAVGLHIHGIMVSFVKTKLTK